MSMDIRQFKGGSVEVTTYANIAAALADRRNNTTGGVFNEWPLGDGFVEMNPGYGEVVYVYLTGTLGTGTGTVYRVALQSLST